MSDPRRGWDKQLEQGLPDCRLIARREEHILIRGRVYERVFCANCGAPGGGVTPIFAAHVFYLCDNCAKKLGPPPGCTEVQPPD